MSQNMGDLTRSSSASKAMRNMGINPGVQAKLMAFQAKRKQQIQQSKNYSIYESDSFNNDQLDTSTITPYDADDDELINYSPIDSKPPPSILNNNSPSTPLSFESSTFSSPIISPNEERKLPDDSGLSRRTSFRLNNNNNSNNTNNTSNTSSNDEMLRRTSFRLNKSNSLTSSSTISDDSEDNLANLEPSTSLDLKKKNSLNSKSKIYPINKNLSFVSKLQKIQPSSSSSNPSSCESLPSTLNPNATQNPNSTFIPALNLPVSQPPSRPLPSLPTLNSFSNNNNDVNSDNDDYNQNPDSLQSTPTSATITITPTEQSTPTEKFHHSIDSNINNIKPVAKHKLSLSQRRGMKLNLDSFNNTNTLESNNNNSIQHNSNSPKTKNTNHNLTTNIHNNNDITNLKNQINKLSLNRSPMMSNHNNNINNNNNRTNMNKLRNGSIPNRRNPANLTLAGLDNLSLKSRRDQPTNTSNNHFTPFAKYVDIKSGSLNFAGKASLHSTGIDFSNGSSFRISMDDLEILEELGHGNYGVVSKVLHKPTGIIMAMKEVRLELDDAKFRQILMELEVLHSCNSDCIVDFYGAFFVEGAVYMCIEYMKGGSLDKVYGNGIPEEPLAYITKRVIIGLKQLKDEQNIIHRDVKPTNMLVNEMGKVKLCDFGVSGNLVASLARTNIGCQSYMAPERIKHTTPDVSTYSVQSDIWSLGLSILEISKGCYPYPPETYNNVFSQLSAIVDGEPPSLPEGKFSPNAHDFVSQCLHKNPNKRPTYGELLKHPWLQMYDDDHGQKLLKELVDISLEKRANGEDGSCSSNKYAPALHNGLQV